MSEQDIPSPINFHDPLAAAEWERTAGNRPGRAQMFEAFGHELRSLRKNDLTVLDLGSGPGFLAAYLLDTVSDLRLTLLDFAAPMHALAHVRLGARAARVQFLERDLKEADWPLGLEPFDVVVTHQAVHELRHKRYASALHTAVRRVLKTGGVYLVSDHYFGEGGFQNTQLYMTPAEQRAALLAAGFSSAVQVAVFGSMVMHRATE